MSLSASQIISLSVICVGLLMVLESFIIVNSKGIDVNGELPFMAFGTLFAAGMPAVLNLLGPWNKSWYWYIFIALLIFSGFTAYIRSRGFSIRMFNFPLKAALTGIEKALKLAHAEYKKEVKEMRDGPVTEYTIGNGKYPIVVTEKKQSPLLDPHIEIMAPEALWNKDLQHELMAFINTSRRNLKKSGAINGIRPRLVIGVLMVFLGTYLFNMSNFALF